MRKRLKIMVVAGARPNFIKINCLIKKLKNDRAFDAKLVHTGQHYDVRLSKIFFDQLRIPKPDFFLGCGSGSHAQQTGSVLSAFEALLERERPKIVVVAGDVNSTVACALAASKMNIAVAHVEAGLRSFDRRMPEEINRKVTDALSDFLFVSEPSGMANLKNEGVDAKKIYFVGNTMLDSLVENKKRIEASDVVKRLGLKGDYAVVTLHRPSNVDSKTALLRVYRALKQASSIARLVYPIHPRSKKSLERHGLLARFREIPGLLLTEPQGYLDFMRLVQGSRFVITDSGGIQEETTFLAVPCLTLRDSTERPVTVEQGTNLLSGERAWRDMAGEIRRLLKKCDRPRRVPAFWDGRACDRIVKILRKQS